ncbi:hypothetical protein ONZ45_g869 [Pleurotus djamor]|nr:hypothetical protein ONZ45_g869 [Pleurotus djamor]
MQQQSGYQPYSYYNPAMYPPQTPHMGAGGSSNGHQAYMPPYYPIQQSAYLPGGASQAGQAMAAAPLARPKKYSQPEPKYNKNIFPRSAMKKTAPEPPPSDLRRQRTLSASSRPNEGLTRARTRSNPAPVEEIRPEFIPIHLFLSFHGTNELQIENAVKQAIGELRHRVVPLWHPGVDMDDLEGYTWRIRFVGSPWNAVAPEVMSAYDIITEIFTLFARRGYTFRTSMKTGTSSPRLIFEVTDIDNDARFFLAYFSRTGRSITLVSPPSEINVHIAQKIKNVLPGSIESDKEIEGGLRRIRLRPSYGGMFVANPIPSIVQPTLPTAPKFGKHLFITYMLKIFDDLGFALEATIPLGRRVPIPFGLGLGPKREIFVFRGSMSQ